MSKPTLPCDIKQECLWIVRGYDRRVRQYHEMRQEIIEQSGCPFHTYKDDKGDDQRQYFSHGSMPGNPTEQKAFKLDKLEQYPEVQKMRAVEHAELRIGLDLVCEEHRQKLTNAILLNCKSGRKYPFEYLDVPGIGKTNFYDRKNQFLCDIAKYLLMI